MARKVEHVATSCTMLTDTVYDGGNLLPMTPRVADTAQECCDMCSSFPGCNFWTHDQNTNFSCGVRCCWLKSSPGIRAYYRANATSGCTSNITAPNCSAPTPHGPWPVPDCPECPPFQPATNRTTGFDVEVSMAQRLPEKLTTTYRKTIGIKGDYKPSIVVLSNGDLLVSSMTGSVAGVGFPIIFRSVDNGGSWTRMDNYTACLGVEFKLVTLHDGTLFLLAAGYPGGGRVFRSTNFGYNFTLVQDWPSARSRSIPYAKTELGWGLVEVNQTEATSYLPQGIYLFPGNTIWRSENTGLNWTLHANVTADDNDGFQSIDSFFGQSFTPFLGSDGVLTHFTRLGVDPTDDQVDGSQIWKSTDGGRTWNCTTNAVGGWCQHHPCSYALKPLSNNPIAVAHAQCAGSTATFGQPGTMYQHILRLADGRILVTWTQRCNGASPYNHHSQPSPYNAPACGQVMDGYGTGLRASVATSTLGGLSFNLSRDVIIIKAQDDWFDAFTSHGCGCGYGNTVQAVDGSLVSVSCYMNATESNEGGGIFAPHLEVLQWYLP